MPISGRRGLRPLQKQAILVSKYLSVNCYAAAAVLHERLSLRGKNSMINAKRYFIKGAVG